MFHCRLKVDISTVMWLKKKKLWEHNIVPLESEGTKQHIFTPRGQYIIVYGKNDIIYQLFLVYHSLRLGIMVPLSIIILNFTLR